MTRLSAPARHIKGACFKFEYVFEFKQTPFLFCPGPGLQTARRPFLINFKPKNHAVITVCDAI